MTPLYSFLTLATGFSLWVLFCFGIYMGLRSLWVLFCFGIYMGLRSIEKQDNGIIVVAGTLALILWGLVFLGVTTLPGVSFDGKMVTDQTSYIFGIGMALLFALLVGGCIVRVASQCEINWWRGVQFSALLLIVAHGIVLFLLLNWNSIFSMIARAERGLGLTRFNDYVAVGYAFFLWLSPLYASFLEMMFRSFRRAWQQNRTGTYVR